MRFHFTPAACFHFITSPEIVTSAYQVKCQVDIWHSKCQVDISFDTKHINTQEETDHTDTGAQRYQSGSGNESDII